MAIFHVEDIKNFVLFLGFCLFDSEDIKNLKTELWC